MKVTILIIATKVFKKCKNKIDILIILIFKIKFAILE